MNRLSHEKKVNIMAREYARFLATQDELMELKLPVLEPLPVSREFKVQEMTSEAKKTCEEATAVDEIVDSFTTSVLEKNMEDTMKSYSIIQEMKAHPKYATYFESYNVSRLLKLSYVAFVQQCDSEDTLLRIGEVNAAVKCYLKKRSDKIRQQISVALRIDSSIGSLGKSACSLIEFIGEEIEHFKAKYQFEIVRRQEVSVYLSEWIYQTVKEYYQTLEPFIYNNEELAGIIKALSVVVDSAVAMEEQGVNVSRIFQKLIAQDLPSHLRKFVDVVLEAIDEVLKCGNDPYEFVYFTSVATFAGDLNKLKPLNKDDYGKKSCSQKGIILINAFILILSPLCDKKWEFLQQSVLEDFLQKAGGSLNSSGQLLHWDYYHFYLFFDRLAVGKIRHKTLFEGELTSLMKQKVDKTKDLAVRCWDFFQTKITQIFWVDILQHLSTLLWTYKGTAQARTPPQPGISSMALKVIQKIEEFLRQIQFRLSREQFEFLVVRFFEYLMFGFEFVIFWPYHERGVKEKVFLLAKKQEKLLKKAKQLAFLEQPCFKENQRILTLPMFSEDGLRHFARDLYVIAGTYRILTQAQKISSEQLVYRFTQIFAKQQRTVPLQLTEAICEPLVKPVLVAFEGDSSRLREFLVE